MPVAPTSSRPLNASAPNETSREASASFHDDAAQQTVCIIRDTLGASETFLSAVERHLPARIVVVYGGQPQIDGRPVLSTSRPACWVRRAQNYLGRRPWDWDFTRAYRKAFRQHRPAVVLAQYGTVGVRVMEACRLSGLPLVVWFWGYDASMHQVVAEHRDRYLAMFKQARALLAVSQSIKQQLVDLGAEPDKIHCVTSGIDCRLFGGAQPQQAPPAFLATGRFVEKKAPHLLLLAFARVVAEYPQARLRMIGDGPLLGVCRDLARGLGIDEQVEFLGLQPPEAVSAAMREARCFVQHSIEAASGDREGTPTSIMEAGASGLPVVATRHAGIPEVVVEQQTGLLVDEHDVAGMADAMLSLARDPELAGRLGTAARARIVEYYSRETAIQRAWQILSSCMEQRGRRGG